MQVIIATGEGNLVYLEVKQGQFVEGGHLKLSADIACLSINPLEPGKEGSTLAAVGTWANAVHLLQMPSLSVLREQQLGGDVIPRSLLFANFEGISFLLIALGEAPFLHGSLKILMLSTEAVEGAGLRISYGMFTPDGQG